MAHFPTAAIGLFGLVSGAALAGLPRRCSSRAVELSARDWLLIVAVGLGPLGAAFFLWDKALKHGDARHIGILSYLTPLASTLLLVVTGPAVQRLDRPAAALIIGAAIVGVRGTLNPRYRLLDSSNISAAGSELVTTSRPIRAMVAPLVPDISKVEPCSRISMNTKSGTSSRISSRNEVKRPPRWIDSTMIACGRPSLQKLHRLVDRADEIDQHAHVAQRVADHHPHLPPRGDDEHVAAGERLGVAGLARGVVDLLGRQARHFFVRRLRELEHQGADAGDVLAFDHQAHRPGGLLDQPPAERIEPRRHRRGDAQVVVHVRGSMPEPAGQPGMHRPGLEIDGEVDVRVGVRQGPVERGVEQAEQERAVDDDARRLELRLQGDAAGLGLAGAQCEHALHRLLRAAALRATGARRPEAKRVSCWPIIPTWRACSTSSRRRAQAGAVDLAGGGEDVDALQRRGQRRRDLGADLGDELMPSLVGRGRHGVGLEISHGNGAQG